MEFLKRWYNRFIVSKHRQQTVTKEYQVFVNEFPFDCVIAGGTLRDYFIYGKVNKAIDIDVFFLSETEQEKAKMWLDGVVNGDNLARLAIGDIYYHHHTKFDVIFNFVFNKIYKSPQELIDSFDFTVCAIAIHKDDIYFNDRFFKDLYQRNISIINLETMTNILHRLAKYKEKGFKVSRDLIMKIFISNKNNPEKLFKEWDDYEGRFVNNFNLSRASELLGIKRICKLKRII